MEDLAITVSEQLWSCAAPRTADIESFVEGLAAHKDLHMIDTVRATGDGVSSFAAAGYHIEAVGVRRGKRRGANTRTGFLSTS